MQEESAGRSRSSPTSRGRSSASASSPQPVVLERGDDVTLVGGEHADDGALPVSPAVIGDVLRPGHDVLIDDGLIRLKVEEVEHGRVRCAVVVGGAVSAHKGVNLPGVPLPIPSLTRRTSTTSTSRSALGVDFVALSFVRSAADVRDLRKLIDDAGSQRARDREDREGRGGRRARRDPRASRTR